MNPRQGLLKPLWFYPARHLWRLANDRDYRVSAWLHARYGRYPRHTPMHCQADGLDLSIPDVASFLSAWDEIFSRQLYRCKLPAHPNILDLGANIGLATLYFLKQFPDASVTALEPDAEIFRHLQHNLANNGGTRVNLLRAAAWVEDTELGFAPDHADGGRILENGSYRVPALDTRHILKNETFDFIKMDIEGAERQVLPALRDLLGKTQRIFVEHHSDPNTPQALDRIISTLSDSGFRLHIESLYKLRHPLMRQTESAFDLQLNIFGRRS